MRFFKNSSAGISGRCHADSPSRIAVESAEKIIHAEICDNHAKEGQDAEPMEKLRIPEDLQSLPVQCEGIHQNFLTILVAVTTIGCGSAIFHPEASRVVQLGAGGRKSLAQSIFQVGGNGGSALGPLLAALVVLPYGQHAVGWMALAILVLMLFSKYFFNACMTSYFTFYLIDKFGVSVKASQICLFAYLAAFAAGTLAGGFLGDRTEGNTSSSSRYSVQPLSPLPCHTSASEGRYSQPS